MNLNVNLNNWKQEKFYKLLRLCTKSYIMSKYKPLILNKKNLAKEGPILLAPNHRETLDPMMIVTVVERLIHWVALKRFFNGEDSIFNNSKNPFLCKLTTVILNGLGAVPIDRDNTNIKTLKTVINYFQDEKVIGAFLEGTTNKKPELQDLLPLENNFIKLAQKYDALVQPVSIVWASKDSNIKNRVIINFREPYRAKNMTVSDAILLLENSLLEGIRENKVLLNDLEKTQNIIDNNKVLSLKI